MTEYVLRHSAKRFAWVYAVCGLFAVVGIWLIGLGDPTGWLALLFFGGGGLACYFFLRSRVILSASSEGVHCNGGTVPWRDIEEIGTYAKWGQASRQTFLGIRLNSYEGWSASLPPERLSRWVKYGDAARWVGAGAVVADIALSGSGLEAATTSLADGPDAVVMAGTKVNSVERLFLLNRRLTGGWDFIFPNQMNDSVKDAAVRLQAMRASALGDLGVEATQPLDDETPSARTAQTPSPQVDSTTTERRPGAMAHPPAGWYPDPDDPTTERWWTGERWSDRRRPPASVAPPPTPPAGWYPDPDPVAVERYWDGASWTSQRRFKS